MYSQVTDTQKTITFSVSFTQNPKVFITPISGNIEVYGFNCPTASLTSQLVIFGGNPASFEWYAIG